MNRKLYKIHFCTVITLIILLCMVSCVTVPVEKSDISDNDRNHVSYNTEVITTYEGSESGMKENEFNDIESLINIKDRYINVFEKGAVGDGNTDDTAAIQAALDYITDGGTVYFPSGIYKVTKNLVVRSGNITICGNNKNSHIIYEYEQRGSDTAATASLFIFAPGTKNIVFKDMKLEYKGEFFPEFGQSYNGLVSGLHFMRNYDVLIENVEIFGFNANGIFVGASKVAYSARIRINGCYLHHNRVAGILYGNVDGISIIDCDMEYNGSQPDGGTGYGCAGSSGAIPKNVQIIGNRANYNYRKGIDLHAGIQAIIEGNICNGNRLYGIYAEGRNTADIIIRNNIVTGMQKTKLDIGEPYTWICGITIGVYEPGEDKTLHNYIISGNIIKDFGLEQGDAYPIFVYHSNNNGYIQIKDNTVNAGNISNLVRFSTRGEKASSYDISLDISGNQMSATGNVKYSPFRIYNYSKLTFSFNQVTFTKPVKNNLVEISNLNSGLTIYTFNNITAPEYGTKDELQINQDDNSKLLKINNFLNGNIS